LVCAGFVITILFSSFFASGQLAANGAGLGLPCLMTLRMEISVAHTLVNIYLSMVALAFLGTNGHLVNIEYLG